MDSFALHTSSCAILHRWPALSAATRSPRCASSLWARWDSLDDKEDYCRQERRPSRVTEPRTNRGSSEIAWFRGKRPLLRVSPGPGIGINPRVGSGAEQAGLEVNHNGANAPH